MSRSVEPVVQFYGLIGQARPPQRADRSAAGTLPTRAYRYCEAVASAAGFGWWAFSPLEFKLLWDGHDIFWRYGESGEWLPLMPAAQFPGFATDFNAVAPAELRDSSPPFLTALPEPGTLQLWTGLMARTAPGWHLLVRAPANLLLSSGFSLYEGIVATDRWFGPLFTVLRLTRTLMPVKLQTDFPLLQIQPVQAVNHIDETLCRMTYVSGMDALLPEHWESYRRSVVEPNQNSNRPLGGYAVAERKRRRSISPSTGIIAYPPR